MIESFKIDPKIIENIKRRFPGQKEFFSRLDEGSIDEKLKAASVLYWCHSSGLRLYGNEPFSIKHHEPQAEVLDDFSPRQCFRKGQQTAGITEAYVLKAFHGARYGYYPKGFMCGFPTGDEVKDFSNTRFKSLIDNNPEAIGRFVRETNSVGLKKIFNSHLYFRGLQLTQNLDGVRRSSSKMKSIPLDGFLVDELDEVSDIATAIAYLRGRITMSKIKHEFYAANPTIPGYGIDKLYNESDQRVWMIKCTHCSKYTCLEMAFPDCLRRVGNDVIKICRKCGREIFSYNGIWVARFPDKAENMVGRWLSKLNADPERVPPASILNEFEKTLKEGGRLTFFYNNVMGIAHTTGDEMLSESKVLDACGSEPMYTAHHGPSAMGIDVQEERKGLHVVIGVKTGEDRYKITNVCRVLTLKDLYGLSKKFNVRCAVADIRPDKRWMREFAENASFPVYLCEYKDDQLTIPSFDSKTGLVKVDRTEVLDETHDLFDRSKIELPRESAMIKEYARQCCNIAKRLVLVGGRKQDKKIYRYLARGQDDFRHATAYYKLATNRITVCHLEQRKGKPKDAWGDWSSGSNHWESMEWMGL